MKKASVIGHFACGLEYLDGQTVKTKTLTKELCRKYGEDDIVRYDTHGGVRTLLRSPFYVWKAMRNSKNVIILPAHNGLRVFGHLLPFFRTFYRNRKIHYVVIGGWMPRMLERERQLERSLKKFDCIYVETNTMRRSLVARGFRNIVVMPNCKELKPLTAGELVYETEPPYRLCTFSRIMKEKGIEDGVRAVTELNEECGRILYTLDIYGPVDPEQAEWFEKLKDTFPEYITYGGAVPYDKSVDVLKGYLALLFPTRFYTEGIPGTIIDCYAAGVPVIGARWQSFDDIVQDGITGVGYRFNDVEDLKEKLYDICSDVGKFNAMKENCIEAGRKYMPSDVIDALSSNLA